MTDDVNFPIEYDKAVIDSFCGNTTNLRVKEFGRSLIHNSAMLVGMSHAVDYKFGKNELQKKMINMKKDLDKKKWEITQNLFKKQLESEEKMIELVNEILISLHQQGDYYDSIFKPQFQRLNLLDNFRLVLILVIIFILITFISWK